METPDIEPSSYAVDLNERRLRPQRSGLVVANAAGLGWTVLAAAELQPPLQPGFLLTVSRTGEPPWPYLDLGSSPGGLTIPSQWETIVPEVGAFLQRMFEEIINRGNLEVADELFAEDFIDHGPMGDIHGREAFKELVAQWRSAVPDVHCELENIFSEGDLAGWLVRTTGTHTGDGLGFPATGRRFETVSANIGRFRDGLAAEHWSEQGMLPMLTQIGVLPAPGA